jgi:RNA polymerase sigma-70 factor (ECF subfamily)
MNTPSNRVLAAVERNRKRLWALCYRMTGLRADADELSQEAVARAIERCDQVGEEDPTGWLLRLTMHLCLDHLRRKKVERRVNELVDPIAGDEWMVGELSAKHPENQVVLREDVRFAVVLALQLLSPRQRAVLILHDVCDRTLEEIARILETNANAVKAVLYRARVALSAVRVHDQVDMPVDTEVVERFARAIEAGAIDVLTELLATNAWGIVDGGGIVQTANKPTYGGRAISRQWANAKRKLSQPVTTNVITLNGERAIVVRLAAAPEIIIAVVHLQTREKLIVALQIHRDPRRIAQIVPLLH